MTATTTEYIYISRLFAILTDSTIKVVSDWQCLDDRAKAMSTRRLIRQNVAQQDAAKYRKQEPRKQIFWRHVPPINNSDKEESWRLWWQQCGPRPLAGGHCR